MSSKNSGAASVPTRTTKTSNREKETSVNGANSSVQHEDAALDAQLGEILRQLRVRTGMTQADVAAHLTISPQQYQKYEKGVTKCNLETIYALAALHNVRPVDILPAPKHVTPPRATELTSNGMQEDIAAFSSEKEVITDEAAAISELLAIFIRIPSKETRRKVLDLLNDIF